jgi:amicoumacin kinase
MKQSEQELLLLAREAIVYWRGAADSLKYQGESTNAVFSFTSAGSSRFLRISASRCRPIVQIGAELDFIIYLHNHGLNVASPLTSINHRFIEPIQQGNYLCVVFEAAMGQPFQFSQPQADQQHFFLRGKILSHLHSLSRSYRAAHHRQRQHWQQDEVFQTIEEYLPRQQTSIWREYDSLMDWLAVRPVDESAFGLIHGDVGTTNFLCHDETITLFDFDDACYHWFLYDLAITFYPHGYKPGAAQLLKALLRGYRGQLCPDSETIHEIVQFCRLRQLYLYLYYTGKWARQSLTAQEARWLVEKRANIERGYQINQIG